MAERSGPSASLRTGVSAPVVLRKRRDVWRDLARILSTIFNPFLCVLALCLILAHALASSSTLSFWWLAFLTTFFTSIGPMLFVFWMYSTDRIADLDMSNRLERERIFAAVVVFYIAGTIVLWLTHSPRLLIATLAGYTLSTVVVQYITRYWKISTHALGITAPLVVLCLLYGKEPLPFLVLIPMVCWARVYLRAHTIMQVVAGAALATFSVGLFFKIFHVAKL